MMHSDELISLSQKYENEICGVLIKIVEEGLAYSKENKYDAIDTFVYIQNKLEKANDVLADSLDTSCSENYNWLMEHFPNIQIKLDNYTEPLFEKARSELQEKINSLLYTTTYYLELKDNLKKLEEYILSKNLYKYNFLLDGLEINGISVPIKQDKTKQKNNI